MQTPVIERVRGGGHDSNDNTPESPPSSMKSPGQTIIDLVSDSSSDYSWLNTSSSSDSSASSGTTASTEELNKLLESEAKEELEQATREDIKAEKEEAEKFTASEFKSAVGINFGNIQELYRGIIPFLREVKSKADDERVNVFPNRLRPFDAKAFEGDAYQNTFIRDLTVLQRIQRITRIKTKLFEDKVMNAFIREWYVGAIVAANTDRGYNSPGRLTPIEEKIYDYLVVKEALAKREKIPMHFWNNVQCISYRGELIDINKRYQSSTHMEVTSYAANFGSPMDTVNYSEVLLRQIQRALYEKLPGTETSEALVDLTRSLYNYSYDQFKPAFITGTFAEFGFIPCLDERPFHLLEPKHVVHYTQMGKKIPISKLVAVVDGKIRAKKVRLQLGEAKSSTRYEERFHKSSQLDSDLPSAVARLAKEEDQEKHDRVEEEFKKQEAVVEERGLSRRVGRRRNLERPVGEVSELFAQKAKESRRF